MPPAITLRDVAAAYGDTEVLRDVALEAAPGEFVAIVGRSGVGRTTLLRVAAGLAEQWRQQQRALLDVGALEKAVEIERVMTDRFLREVYRDGKVVWP